MKRTLKKDFCNLEHQGRQYATLLNAARNHWMGLDKAARIAFRFLYISTDQVYGSLKQHQFLT